MKYYSEILNKNFDTVEDLETAEKAEKKKVLAEAKENAARKAEIDAARKTRDDAKADYEAALKVCREALSRWSAAEKELTAVEKKYGFLMDKDGDWIFRDFSNLLCKFL